MGDVNFTIEAVDKASSAITGIRGAMFTLNQTMGVANQIWRTASQVVDATVGSYVKYADQVRTLTQLTNESAESMSRLVQVADDYKITTDDLTTASRTLSTQGLSLNVETIADLSDKYLALNTGEERQLFLTQNLGRAGKEWTDILSQGSAAILDRNAAVSDSLILDQKALDSTRNYQYSMDDLNDSIMATKMSLAEDFLPILNTVVDYQNRLMDANEKTGASWVRYIPVIGQYYQVYLVLADALKSVASWLEKVNNWINKINWGKAQGFQQGTGGWASGKAAGGSFSGWAMVGDSPGGGRTPYTEYVYAPHGATVFNQSQMSGRSAPPMAGGGFIPPSGTIDISQQSIDKIAYAIMYGVTKLL